VVSFQYRLILGLPSLHLRQILPIQPNFVKHLRLLLLRIFQPQKKLNPDLQNPVRQFLLLRLQLKLDNLVQQL
jgi:hypothetical protein